MRAEFWVAHTEIDPAQLSVRLNRVFGKDDRGVLSHSKLFSGGNWDDKVLFSTESPDYRVICFSSTDLELQMQVEPITGNVPRSAESAWYGMKKVLRDYNPKLAQLKLVDEQSNREFMSGVTGFKTEFQRREVITPIMIGITVIVYSIIALLTFARHSPWQFLSGAITGVVSGLVALGVAWREAGKGILRWN